MRLDEIYREHGDALRRICQSRLGNWADAEDALQECLTRAWVALPRYDEARPMRPWLATIARNVCTDMHRRRGAEMRRWRNEPESAEEPPDPLVADERCRVVREALEGMAPRSATVLYLREVEGWDYDRIGAHVGSNAGAVRTAVTRARQQLRTQVRAVAERRDQWPLLGVSGLVVRLRGRLGGRSGVVSPAGLPIEAGSLMAGGLLAAAVLGLGAFVVTDGDPDSPSAVARPLPAVLELADPTDSGGSLDLVGVGPAPDSPSRPVASGAGEGPALPVSIPDGSLEVVSTVQTAVDGVLPPSEPLDEVALPTAIGGTAGLVPDPSNVDEDLPDLPVLP